jgi:uncharacterized protein YcbX
MAGEDVTEATITERGILGDRMYALVDQETGRVASAKHPRKWGALLNCHPAYGQPPTVDGSAPPLRITLPDGRMVDSEREDASGILSNLLDREVALEQTAPEQASRETYWPVIEGYNSDERVTTDAIAWGAPAGTFFDYAVLHIVTTSTLDHLARLYPDGRFEVPRFRPNLLINVDDSEPGFAENDWLGRTMTIGDEVRLRIIDPCPRCVVTTLPQGDLPTDRGILRTIAQHNEAESATAAPGVVMRAVVGVYGSVEQRGVVRLGDTVRIFG